jgi:flavin-binding protein dodecin
LASQLNNILLHFRSKIDSLLTNSDQEADDNVDNVDWLSSYLRRVTISLINIMAYRVNLKVSSSYSVSSYYFGGLQHPLKLNSHGLYKLVLIVSRVLAECTH